MPSLLQHAGEYFLGTEHYRHYTRRKAVRSEFIVDPNELKEDKRRCRNELVMLLGYFKAGPALMTLGSLAVLGSTGIPLYGIFALAEAWRAGGTWVLRDMRKIDDRVDDSLKRSTLRLSRDERDAETGFASTLEDWLNDHDKGEGWKRGSSDEWRPNQNDDEGGLIDP